MCRPVLGYRPNFKSLTKEENVKPFWNFIKSKKRDSSGIAPLKSNGILHSEASNKANILNKLNNSNLVFSTDIPIASPLPKPPGINYTKIDHLKITISGVDKLLKNFKISKAAGPYGIPNALLKELHNELADNNLSV